MRNLDKRLEAVISVLNEMKDAGGAESGQIEAAVRSVDELGHALAVRDLPRIRALVGKLCQIFTSGV